MCFTSLWRQTGWLLKSFREPIKVHRAWFLFVLFQALEALKKRNNTTKHLLFLWNASLFIFLFFIAEAMMFLEGRRHFLETDACSSEEAPISKLWNPLKSFTNFSITTKVHRQRSGSNSSTTVEVESCHPPVRYFEFLSLRIVVAVVVVE